MKPSAFTRYRYSGDLYKYVVKNVGSQEVVEFYFAETIPLTATIDANQRVHISTDEPMTVGNLIANIKDRSGNLLLTDMVWQISTAGPIVDAFGNVDHYSCRVIKFQGEIE